MRGHDLLKHKCQKGTSKIKAYIEIQFENCKNNYFELSKQIEGEIINTKERQNFWEGLGSKNFIRWYFLIETKMPLCR